jgi:hypothetical protein
MRLLLALFLCLISVLSGLAQERVRNVRVRAVDSSRIEIGYDLINARPGDSVYFEIRSRLRGNVRISPEFVRGDIGRNITTGTNRRIIWDALANGYSLNEEIQAKVLVKTGLLPMLATTTQPPAEPVVAPKSAITTPAPEAVPPKPTRSEPLVSPAPQPSAPATEPPVVLTPKTRSKKTKREKPFVSIADSVKTAPAPPAVQTPVPQQPVPRSEPVTRPTEPNPAPVPAYPDTVRVRRTRYIGPAWALLSAVAPGIGNIFVQTPKPKVGLRPLLTVGSYGLVVYGLMERQKSQDEYAIYEQQKNSTAGEPYYQTANDHHHNYFIATRAALAVAAADVILTFIRGVRNTRSQKEARRYQSVMVRPGLQASQPTAVLTFKF